MGHPDRARRRTDRAVSEVISYVLVVSLVLSTVAIVSVSGVSILQNARDAERIDNAERAFDLLADNMADIYREGAPSRSTEIRLSNSRFVSQQNTYINVSGTDETGAAFSHNLSTWSLGYRTDADEAIVYDAGAVFTRTAGGRAGVSLRPPPIVVRENRVVVTVPRNEGNGTDAVSGGTALVRATRQDTTVLEADVRDADNYGNLRITITSPFFESWRQTLDDRANVSCTDSDPGDRRITCDLTPTGNFAFYFTTVDIRVELSR